MVQAMPGSSDAHEVYLLTLVHEPPNNVVHLVCRVACGYKRAVNLPEDTNLVLHVLHQSHKYIYDNVFIRYFW